MALGTQIDFSVFGGDSEEVTPVPFSNTEVKLFSADGTAWETMWESRTPPNLFLDRSLLAPVFFAFFTTNTIKPSRRPSTSVGQQALSPKCKKPVNQSASQQSPSLHGIIIAEIILTIRIVAAF